MLRQGSCFASGGPAQPKRDRDRGQTLFSLLRLQLGMLVQPPELLQTGNQPMPTGALVLRVRPLPRAQVPPARRGAVHRVRRPPGAARAPSTQARERTPGGGAPAPGIPQTGARGPP